MPSAIRLYNVLTKKKAALRTLRAGHVGLYACGPTVYNFVHIGNLRTYIFEDVLRRTIEYAGHTVRHVVNITDVEDKIMRDAAAAGVDIFTFVRPYEEAFFADLDRLNIKRAWRYPRATAHIAEMLKLIAELMRQGLAYEMDGSVYFAVRKFSTYGRLSGAHARSPNSNARIDVDEYAKQDAEDFVLWKGKKGDEHSWPSLYGDGRPGWHIECAAMAMKYLGTTFDIHAGGVDLIFPHHENEIAEAEGATGEPFARVFVEGEHLLVDGEKMSKSLGNFYTMRDFEERGIDPIAFRYLVLTSHYRSKLNFTWVSLAAAAEGLERLRQFVLELRVKRSSAASTKSASLATYIRGFESALYDDLNTPQAIAHLWELIRDYHACPERYSTREVLALLVRADAILGLGLKELKPIAVPKEVRALARVREGYRAAKQWDDADRARREIEAFGFAVDDTASGPKFRKISA